MYVCIALLFGIALREQILGYFKSHAHTNTHTHTHTAHDSSFDERKCFLPLKGVPVKHGGTKFGT